MPNAERPDGGMLVVEAPQARHRWICTDGRVTQCLDCGRWVAYGESLDDVPCEEEDDA